MPFELEAVLIVEEVDEEFDEFRLMGMIMLQKTLLLFLVKIKLADNGLHDKF